MEKTNLDSRQSTSAITTSRLIFVDNIRIFLTILVILFHLMITYAGTGSWYYMEGQEDLFTSAIGAWFLTVTQAYFMGLFLLISAYFVPGSYDRKGAGRFLKDRVIRLGIPLALYSWIIRPLLAYLDPVRFPAGRPPFWDFLTANYFKNEAIFGSGPLWFIETLLIFSAVYVLWRILAPRHPVEPTLQFPFFAQYIALFIVGLIAYRHDWLRNLPKRIGRLWLRIAIILILLFWPIILGGGVVEQGLDPFRGGLHWQALVYALWESFLGLAMCIGLIYAFQQYGNRQRRVTSYLSRNAYTAYLIHEVIIIAIAYAVIDVALYPLLKFVLVGLVTVPLCFTLSTLIRKLPYADQVL